MTGWAAGSVTHRFQERGPGGVPWEQPVGVHRVLRASDLALPTPQL
jgi:hypothetical protein